MRVLKWPFTGGVVERDVPGQVLHVGFDGNQDICAWSLVTGKENPDTETRVRIVGTGQVLPDCLGVIHISTFMESGFVFHAFEVFDLDDDEPLEGVAS